MKTSPDGAPADFRPPLLADRSFWAMTITQFFGAFNDNLFKQLVLLLAANLAAQSAGPRHGPNQQGLAMFIFATPFILFATLSGFTADRFSKTRIIVLAKLAEIAIMTLGLVGFLFFPVTGFTGLCIVLFLMGTHSTFFAPAKYGVLPEMLRDTDLPQANGIFLMTTFLAIIFGMATAGWLSELFSGRLWIASLVGIGLAIVGTISAFMVRPLPAANPQLKFTGAALGVPREMRTLLASDSLLVAALVVCSLFWLIGGVIQPVVNEFGIHQLQLGDKKTSYMQAAVGVGIAIGCLIGGAMSKDRVRFSLTRLGSLGIMVCLGLLSLTGSNPEKPHLFGYPGSLPILAALGAFAGIFVVPLQVFIQSRPPADQKGRMVAFMNLCTWIGIIISAVLVMVIDWVQTRFGWPKSSAFLMMSIVIVPVLVFFRAKDQPLSKR